MESLAFYFLLLFSFLHSTLCDDQFRIIQPSSLVSQFSSTNGTVANRPALFGVPPFGRAITGLVVWGTPGDLDGCQPITPNSSWSHPLIMMVDRGDCTFVTKVRNAENAGAQAVIVVDNVDESTLPYMADDGTGASINIPSVLIYKGDGQKIKDTLANSTVIATLIWDVPSPDDRVEWTLYTSSNDPSSKDFKAVFGEAVRALNTSAQFTPHFYILNGTAIYCRNPPGICGSQCTNEGRYCAVDPDMDPDSGLSGADIVSENLRQLCIFQVVNSTNTPWVWWDYVAGFQRNCSTNFSKTCSDSVLTSIGVNATLVAACVSNQNKTSDANIDMLDAELRNITQDGVFYFPTVIINTDTYRGSLSCPTPISPSSCGVLGGICSGYPDTSLPCACTSDVGCALCVYRDECGVCGGDGEIDVCGQCLNVTSPSFNKSCADCFGVPNGNSSLDPCGVCNGTGSLDNCHRCLQQNDPIRVDAGGIDACGQCYNYSDPNYNKTCMGCDGVVNSGAARDACGECGGTKTKDQCASSALSVSAIVGIVFACVGVVALGVFFFLRRQQAKMRDDIDNLLAQYQPLDGSQNRSPAQTHQLAPLAAAPRSDEL